MVSQNLIYSVLYSNLTCPYFTVIVLNVTESLLFLSLITIKSHRREQGKIQTTSDPIKETVKKEKERMTKQIISCTKSRE